MLQFLRELFDQLMRMSPGALRALSLLVSWCVVGLLVWVLLTLLIWFRDFGMPSAGAVLLGVQ